MAEVIHPPNKPLRIEAIRARIEAIKARLAVINLGSSNRIFHRDEIARLRAELAELEAAVQSS